MDFFWEINHSLVSLLAYYTPPHDILHLQAGRLRRDYYAAISWMDSQLSRVTATLAELGLTNDTLIVFHADHGWSLGEHGEWEKVRGRMEIVGSKMNRERNVDARGGERR